MTPIRSRGAGEQGSRGESEKVSPAHPRARALAHPPLHSPAPLLPYSLAAFALPLLVYLLTMPPGVTWAHHGADAGDLITAACTLGVPHPSGYPTYTLLGWLACQIPLGNIAWRFNLLSAVGAAGGAWFLFKSVLSFKFRVPGSRFQTQNPKPKTKNPKPETRNPKLETQNPKLETQNPKPETRNPKPETRNPKPQPIAALLAAWSLAFTPLVWSQVIIAEVYGVNLFFVGLLLCLSLQVRQGRTRYIFWLGLAFGLSLGVHLTNLFLLPLLGWSAFGIQRSAAGGQRSAFSSFILLISSFALGLLIFAYLPLRAGKAPITWGAPNTLFGFWELVSGQIYHRYLFAAPLRLLDDRLLASLRYLTGGLFVGILAGFGLLKLWRRAKDLFWLTLLTSSFYIVYALGYNTVDSYVYFLPVFVFIGLWAGVGVREWGSGGVGEWRSGGVREQGSGGVEEWGSGGVEVRNPPSDSHTPLPLHSPTPLLLILPLLLIPLNFARISLRNDRAAEIFWQSALSQAPPHALLLTSQDKYTLTLWYARFALGKRPDVLTVDTRLADYPWHQRDLQKLDPELTNPAELATLFEQGKTYRRPLCRVSAQEDGQATLKCSAAKKKW